MTRRRFAIVLGWFGGVGTWLARTSIGLGGDEAGKRPGGTDRFGDPLPPGALARFGTTRLWHAPGGLGVESLAVSPDGRIVATAGVEPPVVLWDLATGREIRRLGNPPRHEPIDPLQFLIPADGGNKPDAAVLGGRLLYDVAFTPDGSVLAAGGHPDGRVERWEVASGKALAPFTGGHRSAVLRLAFARSGETLATGDQDGLVLLRDAASGRVRLRLGPHEDHVAVLAVSDDGRTVISGGWNRSTRVSVWDAATGRLVRKLDAPPFDPFDNLSIAMAPGGALVAVGREGYRIVVWDVRTGKIVVTLDEEQEQDLQEGDPHERHDEVAGLAFSPDGKTLASAGRDASVRLWDVATWAERRRLDWHEGDAEAVAFSPDGTSLVAAGDAGVVRTWTLPEGRERVRTAGHRAGVSHLAWAPDGRSVVSVGADDAVCVIDPATGEQVRREALLPRICYDVDLALDGRLLAYQGLRSDRRVSVVEAGTGRVVRVVDLRGERGAVLLPRFSSDGRLLFVGDVERDDERTLIVVYDLAARKESRRMVAEEYFADFEVSPDGRLLGTRWVSDVFVYEVTTGRLRHRLQHKREWPDHGVDDIAFSPDGALLATAGRDGNVRLWDMATGRALRSLVGHPGGVSRVAFSPDGKTLASTSLDEPVVRLYEVSTGREVKRLEGHLSGVLCLAFAPDGRRLATGSLDTTVLVWEL